MVRLEKKHIKPVSLMLARAFKDEWKDILPDPDERRAKEPYINEYYLRRDYPFDIACITSPRIEGIAIWSRSDKIVKSASLKIISTGAIWLAKKIGFQVLRKIEALDQILENKRRELAPDKHWYFWVLAADPIYQGKGYGSILRNETLPRIDKDGLPCYLETEGEKNVSIYQHFGFQVIEEFSVPGMDGKLIAMLRQPEGKQTKSGIGQD